MGSSVPGSPFRRTSGALGLPPSSAVRPRAGRFWDHVRHAGRRGAPLVVGGVHGDEPASVEAVAARATAGAATAARSARAGAQPRRPARGAKNRRATSISTGTFPRATGRPRTRPGIFPARRRCPSPRHAFWPSSSTGGPCAASSPSTRRSPASTTTDRRPPRRGPRPWPRSAAGPRAATSAIPRRARWAAGWAWIRGLPVLTLELPPGPMPRLAGRPRRLDEAVRPGVSMKDPSNQVVSG